MVSFKNIKSFALISVFDKSNLDFLCDLFKKYKIGIISSGSTSKRIRSLGYNCVEISKLTKFNEVLDGRVKTLHPNIYISLLHNRNNYDHKKTFKNTNFPKIDFVIVNLYPFSKYKKNKSYNAIEMIDVGGPTLLRAAAKNFESVTPINSPSDYPLLMKNIERNSGITDLSFRKKMAAKTFKAISKYDQIIYNWFINNKDEEGIKLKYGENPHQKAQLKIKKTRNLSNYKIQGKEISFNNILDVDSGLDFLNEFKEPTTVIIKHNNACGVASSSTIKKSFVRALKSDKKSAFGGVVLLNKKLESNLAKILIKNFFEVVVSPGYTHEAIKILSLRKNLILINSNMIPKKQKKIIKSVRIGNLIQENDSFKLSKKHFKIVSKNKRLT